MSDWSSAALGDVATIVREVIDPGRITDGTMYVGLENIPRGGGLTGVHTVDRGDIASAKFVFDESHVLFGKLRPNLAKVARPTFHGVCSTDILPIAAGPRLDRDYLACFLSHPDTVSLAARRATGANLPRLSPKQLARFDIPLPPIDEQRRIARVLDAADGLRGKRDRTLATLETYVDSLFAEMFVIGAADGWLATTVGDLVDPDRGGIRTGPFGSQLLHSEFVDEGVAVLGIDNAVTNEFRWARPRHITKAKYAALTRYAVHPGDVLITIMGTCGRAAVVPEDVPPAINTKHLCCITLDQGRCLPSFLHAYFLRHPIARSYLLARAKGAIMSGLNMGIIRGLPVSLPPIAVQREFAGWSERIGDAKRLAVRHRHQLDVLFASLQHRAFTGAL